MTVESRCAEVAARKAGEAILSLIDTATIAEKESSYNLVTSADTHSQKIIVEHIKKTFPNDVILGEESAEKQPSVTTDRLWIIDPIDGTTNFAHHIPHYSISIAFAQKGVVQCGIVFDPSKNELFSAVRSQGALCNNKPIHTSKVSTLTKSIVATGFYYERGPIMLKTLDSIKNLMLSNIQGIRRMGSAALDLCYVACGRYDAYFEYRLSPWDFAAGLLIVQEAGGVCLDSDGIHRGLNSQGMISCAPDIQSDFLSIVQWSNTTL